MRARGEHHTRQGHWSGNPAARSTRRGRYGSTDVGRVLAAGEHKYANPCECTGLVHEHDAGVCPAEPVEATS